MEKKKTITTVNKPLVKKQVKVTKIATRRTKPPRFAGIDFIKGKRTHHNGTESYIQIFTDQKAFLAEYDKYICSVGFEITVSNSPKDIYYVLICKIVNGKPLCW